MSRLHAAAVLLSTRYSFVGGLNFTSLIHGPSPAVLHRDRLPTAHSVFSRAKQVCPDAWQQLFQGTSVRSNQILFGKPVLTSEK